MITKTVGVIIIEENRVLLVKHLEKASHPTGIYGLPAGRLKYREDYITAAKRELEEETGLKTEDQHLKLLPTEYTAVLERENKVLESMVMKVYFCTKYSGTLKSSSETKPEWIALNHLESLNTLPNVLTAISEAIKFQ
jgi:ADP-ribose pyrophosphatase YjhB (NUDIX family)